ncbi:MAG: DNA repair protein RadC [Deltaproteobacteria bacterium]|nr:DNA repair protein RadC [Deltaproteobacteria bacterium]
MKTIRWQFVMEGTGEYIPFRSADDVVRRMHAAGHADRDRECFVAFLLNTKHNIIAEEVVSIGILDGSLVHPREVYKAAVCAGAASVIVAHNHPSGDTTPSVQDREVTTRLRDAGKIIGIPLVDHVIVGAGTSDFFSFRTTGTW